MNKYTKKLNDATVEYIFSLFGMRFDDDKYSLRHSYIFDNKNYYSENKVVFFVEQDEKIECPIYSATYLLDKINFDVMLCDLSENSVEKEFALLFKASNAMPFFLKQDNFSDEGSVFLSKTKETIFEPDIIAKSKFLIGIESLLSMFPVFHKMDKEEDKNMYNLLLSFLDIGE